MERLSVADYIELDGTAPYSHIAKPSAHVHHISYDLLIENNLPSTEPDRWLADWFRFLLRTHR